MVFDQENGNATTTTPNKGTPKLQKAFSPKIRVLKSDGFEEKKNSITFYRPCL